MNTVLHKIDFLDYNPTIESNSGLYDRPFYMDETTINCNVKYMIKFIKFTERVVRKHPDYKKYLSYLKEDLKLNRCSILGNITDEDAPIEMHHGPILNLFDICRLTMLKQIKEIGVATTFSVAEEVMDLHFENKIQFVMLSESVHQSFHGANRFLNLKHAYGDLDGYLDIYSDYMTEYQVNVIRKYMELSEKYDTDILDMVKLGEILGEFQY